MMITGNTTIDKIIRVVNDYNNGLVKVLLLSSAGSESLHLKGTRQIHIMEPHWNDAKIQQVIGRAIRYKSHSYLPKEQQHVTIYKWISVFPSIIEYKSADQYLLELSDKKLRIFNEFKQILIDSSIENTVNKRAGYRQQYLYYKHKYFDLVSKYY